MRYFRLILTSFFLVACSNVFASVLVIAPHPDDDVITVSGIIYSAVQRGETVKVVYITNGDINGVSQGLLRQGEAVNAQVNFLGTMEDDLIFLGYPDGHLQEIFDNYINSNDRFTTPFGQSVTYGDRGLGSTDYHTYWSGEPALYNRYNIVLDLTRLILTSKPDHIFTVSEFDNHADHFTTYGLLKLALAEIFQVDPTYQPTIHKTIIWSTAPAEWPLPLNPATYHVEVPDLNRTDLQWNQRESIDVPIAMQSFDFSINNKYQAIASHASQGGVNGFIGKFIHKDEFFWVENLSNAIQPPIVSAGSDENVQEGDNVTLDGSGSLDPNGGSLSYQWIQTGGITVNLAGANTVQPTFLAPIGLSQNQTLSFQLRVSNGQFTSIPDLVNITVRSTQTGDNVALLASVRASSQNSGSGQLASKVIDGVIDGWPGDFTREWATNGEGAGAWIELNWNSVYIIDRIILYDRPNLDDHITNATLQFSDGSSVTVGALDNSGGAIEINFAPRSITNVRLAIDSVSSSTLNIGLAEFEVFGTTDPGINIPPQADAGPDQTVEQAEFVLLDGNGSFDPNGDPLSYQWIQTAGIAVDLAGANTVQPTFLAPIGLSQNQTLSFQLRVNDGQLTSIPDLVNVTVRSTQTTDNVALLASASASSQNSGSGQLASKVIDGVIDGWPGDFTREWATNGEGADAWIELNWNSVYVIDRIVLYDRPNPDDHITNATLQFSDGSSVVIGALDNSGGAIEVNFAPRSITSVRLTINAVSSSTLNIGLAEYEVYGTNDPGMNIPPQADAGPDQMVEQGEFVTLDGKGSFDPNGDPLSYQWIQTAGIAVDLSGANTVQPSFIAPAGLSQNQILTFQLSVNDGQLTSIPDLMNVTVRSTLTSDNVALLASISASSQNTGTTQLASKVIDGIIDGWPGDFTREWATNGEGAGAWIELNWNSVYLVDRIVLYDRPNPDDHITNATLQFSDGSSVVIGALDNSGGAIEVNFAPRSITSVRLTINAVSSSTLNIGLAEFEVFANNL